MPTSLAALSALSSLFASDIASLCAASVRVRFLAHSCIAMPR